MSKGCAKNPDFLAQTRNPRKWSADLYPAGPFGNCESHGVGQNRAFVVFCYSGLCRSNPNRPPTLYLTAGTSRLADMGPDLSVQLGSLRLSSPVLVASGTFGYAREMAG